MTKDFMGRFPIVIHYDDLDTKALVDLLTNSSISPLKREKETFRKAGVKLTVTEGYKEAVARAACDLETGARGLNRFLEILFSEALEKIKDAFSDTKQEIENYHL